MANMRDGFVIGKECQSTIGKCLEIHKDRLIFNALEARDRLRGCAERRLGSLQAVQVRLTLSSGKLSSSGHHACFIFVNKHLTCSYTVSKYTY